MIIKVFNEFWYGCNFLMMEFNIQTRCTQVEDLNNA